MHRVLVGSPVRQLPPILREFLTSLNELDDGPLTLDFAFVDDNDDPAASALLAAFRASGAVQILPGSPRTDAYLTDEQTHHWQYALYRRVGAFKDRLIALAREDGYDGLFLVDSDIVLHPLTVQHLAAAGVDVCAEIFWTRWTPDGPELPQVWMMDEYTLFTHDRGEAVDPEEAVRREEAFLNRLHQPGLYEVGGLGACTLISRHAIERGVSFREIPNLSVTGEDRDFCIRAAALGLKLHVDTHYPALHLYRNRDLARVADFKAGVGSVPRRAADAGTPPITKRAVPFVRKATGNRLTLSMLVRNEADRHLPRVLAHAASYVDAAVIVDDASTDATVAVCRALLADLPHAIVSSSESRFHREHELRRLQWRLTLATEPDWVLCLDGDEVFEDAIRNRIRSLIDQTESDAVLFRLYDFWDVDHYRDDAHWQAHHRHWPLLVRPLPGLSDAWQETPQHAGRFPPSVNALARMHSDLRVKHLGWATPEARRTKYERYRHLDPDAVYGWRDQYESILDPHPTLRRWED